MYKVFRLFLLILVATPNIPLLAQSRMEWARGAFFTTSDSVKLFVKVRGEGTPCLYLHGGPGSGSHWLEKFSGEMLERNFRMIYLDQRGVGRSSSPADGDYSLERMVRDFEELRAALGLENWLTLGHSFGGILQMGYAVRHPEAVRGMLMINCTLYMNESLGASWIPQACKLLEIEDPSAWLDQSKPLLERVGDLAGRMKEKDLFWRMGYTEKRNEEIMSASFSDIPDWNNAFEEIPLVRQDYMEDFRQYTAGMKIPVLYYYGKSDWMVGPEHYRGLRFPNMLLWSSPVGHMPFLENPADLERAVAAFRAKFGL